VGDVGERPGVDEGGLPFQRLQQVGVQGVLHQHRHRAGHAQIVKGDGLAVLVRADDRAAGALAQVVQSALVVVAFDQGQDGHDLAGDGDVEAGLARAAVVFRPQADEDFAQGAIVGVRHPVPGQAIGVDVQPRQPDLGQLLVVHAVFVIPAGINGRGDEVVGGGDGVDVAGQMQVEVLHRDDLAIAAAGRAALDAECRPHAGLADAGDGLVAEDAQTLHQADAGRRLALAERGGSDGRHVDVLAHRPVGQLGQGVEVDFGFGFAVVDQVVFGQAQLGGDFLDGQWRGGLSDVQVGRYGGQTLGCVVHVSPQCGAGRGGGHSRGGAAGGE